MRENEKSILPNEAEAAFGVENAAEPERAERRITAENLWEIIASLQGNTFYTAKNLPFTYTVKGGELFTDRRGRSVTRSTFEKAFEKNTFRRGRDGSEKIEHVRCAVCVCGFEGHRSRTAPRSGARKGVR